MVSLIVIREVKGEGDRERGGGGEQDSFLNALNLITSISMCSSNLYVGCSLGISSDTSFFYLW